MYEELVKELRLACDDERYSGKYLYLSLINRAADAIEKLQAYADLYRDGGETAMRAVEQYKTAYMAEHDAKEELLRAAKKMHTWIFLNTGDEQKAYDECGLSDEMNAALGYGGRLEIVVPKEETE